MNSYPNGCPKFEFKCMSVWRTTPHSIVSSFANPNGTYSIRPAVVGRSVYANQSFFVLRLDRIACSTMTSIASPVHFDNRRLPLMLGPIVARVALVNFRHRRDDVAPTPFDDRVFSVPDPVPSPCLSPNSIACSTQHGILTNKCVPSPVPSVRLLHDSSMQDHLLKIQD